MDSDENDLDEWNAYLEGLKIQMSEFITRGSVTDEDFIILVLNNVPEKNDVILDGLEGHLTLIVQDKLK